MKKIKYFEILKDAWQVTWKNRYLWWFGFLTIFSGGGTIYFNFGEKNEKEFQKVVEFFSIHPNAAIAILVMAVAFCLLFLILGIIAEGALIKSVQKTLGGEKYNFKAGLKEGRKYFWKLFLIRLVAGFFIFAVAFLFAVPITFIFINKFYLLGILAAVLGLLILIPVLFLACFTKKFGYFYAVMFDLSLGESLENGYKLILNNIWNSLLVAVIFVVIKILVFSLILLALLLLVVPVLIIGGIFFLILKMTGVILVAILVGLVLAVFFFAVGSVFKVFTETAWILFFKEIAKTEEKEIVAEKELEIKPAEIDGVPA
jgi:hypothetical protein